MTDIMYHNISEKKIFYFSEILWVKNAKLTQILELQNQEVTSRKS